MQQCGHWDEARIRPLFRALRPGAFDGTERADPRGDAEERRRIIAALDANGWRRQDTAACLGISRKVLWEKMRKFQIADSEAEPA
ncbi:Bacterial regulatory protein, Fis family [compost metagenome]